jgi:hypothetical protein
LPPRRLKIAEFVIDGWCFLLTMRRCADMVEAGGRPWPVLAHPSTSWRLVQSEAERSLAWSVARVRNDDDFSCVIVGR